MNGVALGDVPFDLVEEADDFLMPVALHVLALSAMRRIACRQRMTDPYSTWSAAKSVVVPLRLQSWVIMPKACFQHDVGPRAFLSGGPGPVKRLYLRLFIHRQHNRMSRR